jgi:hypothetical protein
MIFSDTIPSGNLGDGFGYGHLSRGRADETLPVSTLGDCRITSLGAVGFWFRLFAAYI